MAVTELTKIYTKTNNVVLNDCVDFRKDIVVSADYSCFGSSADGGAGFCIYFYGGHVLDQSIGSPGPGLGYAPTDGLVKIGEDGSDVFTGVNNAVLGVGFDISGYFAQPLGGDVTTGDSVPHPNAITLRKGTDDNFEYIGSSSNLSTDYAFNLYQQYGSEAPVATSTPTPTQTQTQTSTFTDTCGSTATPTPTQSRTPTQTRTRTPSQTQTQTQTQTPTRTLVTTQTQTRTPTRTHTPTQTPTPTRTSSQTPTTTGVFPNRKSVKVRITDFGRKVIIYVRNSQAGDYTKVYEKVGLNLSILGSSVETSPGHVMVGLSYATGLNYSKFYLYKFEVNGIGYQGRYTPTPTRTQTRTQTQTRTSTPDPTRTRTPSQTQTRTRTPTQTRSRTPTYTRTPTQTRTETRVPTPTQTRTRTPSQTRTQTRTSTQTRTRTRTRTPTYTRTQTQTRTPTKPMECAPCSYMFRFTGMWYSCDDFDKAIKILMNNVRYWFNESESDDYLFAYNNTGTGENLVERPWKPPRYNVGDWPTGTLTTEYGPVAGNNEFVQAWYFAGTPEDGQQTKSGHDLVSGWTPVPFKPAGGGWTQQSNDQWDPYKYRPPLEPIPPISNNIYTALNTLFTTGGVTYEDTLLHLNALDDSDKRQLPANNAGKNYNIWTPGDPAAYLNPAKTAWTIDPDNYELAQGKFDQWGISYPFSTLTQEQILYNFDYITGSPLLPGVEKSKGDFIAREDRLRPVPNTRYLRINQGDIDITFSYATELIQIQEGIHEHPDLEGERGHVHSVLKSETGKAYLGARITLWTSADQQGWGG